MSVYKKILSVMQDVEYLQKDDSISFGNTKYKAISEEKVTSTIRASLIKNGLVIIPVEQEHMKVDNLTTVNVKYKIVDVDTGEYEIAMSSGTGVDTQDKGVGKAMTYSYKYLLLRTFAIPTGEDPDKVSSAELDAKQKEQPKKQDKFLEQCVPLPTLGTIQPQTIGDIKKLWLLLGYKVSALNTQVKKSYGHNDLTGMSEEEGQDFFNKLNAKKEELEKGA